MFKLLAIETKALKFDIRVDETAQKMARMSAS